MYYLVSDVYYLVSDADLGIHRHLQPAVQPDYGRL